LGTQLFRWRIALLHQEERKFLVEQIPTLLFALGIRRVAEPTRAFLVGCRQKILELDQSIENSRKSTLD
jgi:hypothetical protein